jgi:hypothetical protein
MAPALSETDAIPVNENAVGENVSYWAKYLASTEPCQFPTQNDGVDGQNQLEQLPVNVETLKLQEFCKVQEVSLINIFQLAWAMVLRSYARSESVSFGYGSDGFRLHKDQDVDIVLPLAVKVGQNLTIAEALRNIAADYSVGIKRLNEWPADKVVPFHTKLVLHTSLVERQYEQQLEVSTAIKRRLQEANLVECDYAAHHRH